MSTNSENLSELQPPFTIIPAAPGYTRIRVWWGPHKLDPSETEAFVAERGPIIAWQIDHRDLYPEPILPFYFCKSGPDNFRHHDYTIGPDGVPVDTPFKDEEHLLASLRGEF